MPRSQWTEDEERQIEMGVEIRKRHSKALADERAAEEAARPKYDPAKPETNRRKAQAADRRVPTAAPKKKNSLFAA